MVRRFLCLVGYKLFSDASKIDDADAAAADDDDDYVADDDDSDRRSSSELGASSRCDLGRDLDRRLRRKCVFHYLLI